MLRALLFSSSVLVAGCACKLPVDPADFEIGQGEHEFARLDTHGFDVVYGGSGQGLASQHIWIALVCAACTEGGTFGVALQGTDADTGAIVSPAASEGVSFRVCRQEGLEWGKTVGLRLRLDDEALQDKGSAVTVLATVSSEAGDLVASGDVTAPY